MTLDNKKRIDCLHEQDGYIQITVPALAAEEFKHMAVRAINTWQDASPEMRDFIDRLTKKVPTDPDRGAVIDRLIEMPPTKMHNPVVGYPIRAPLFDDRTSKAISYLSSIERLLKDYPTMALTGNGHDVLEGTRQLIFLKHGKVNQELLGSLIDIWVTLRGIKDIMDADHHKANRVRPGE